MQNISYEELDDLLLEGSHAQAYAWEHYDELSARECAHRLYGPYCSGLGAGIPGSLTSKQNRQLTKQTRRKDYHVYELDFEYKLIRMISVVNYGEVEMVYHCFEIEGVRYAVPFRGKSKVLTGCENVVMKYQDDKPVYLGLVKGSYLLAHFYEYITNENVYVTCYSYSPNAMCSAHGYPVEKNAPVGSLASPVEKGTWEEEIRYTVFSEWFK